MLGKISKVMVGVLIGLMVLSFAVWGMEDVFSQGSRNAVVTLGDEPIEAQEFRDAFRNQVNIANESRAQGLTNEEAVRMGLHTRTLETLVTRKALALDARDLGVGVDSDLARNVLRNNARYVDPFTNELDFEAIDADARRNGQTRAQFEAALVDDLSVQQIVPAIVEGITIPDAFARYRYRFINERRVADVLTLTTDAIDPPAPPTDAELDAWISTNSARYTAPEMRRFEMIRIETFDFLQDIDLSEDDIRDYYDYLVGLPPSSDGSLATEQFRSVVSIQAADEAEAKRLAERLAAGEDPDTVAASVGATAIIRTDAAKGTITDRNIADFAFEQDAGQAGAVFGSLPYWYAVATTDVTGGETPSFEDARADVEIELKRDRAVGLVEDTAIAIEDEMDSNASFEDISVDLGIPISIYDFVDRTGRTEDGVLMRGFSRIPGIATDDAILREVFTIDIDYESDLLETGTGGYFAVRVIDVLDETRRPMDAIRETAVADYLTDRTTTALRDLGTTIQQRVRAGETLAAIAAELGLETSRELVLRTAPNPELGPAITAELQSAKRGDVVRGPGSTDDAYQVAVLSDIQGTGDRLAGTYAEAINAQARAQIASDLQTLYRGAILADYPPQTNEALVRSTLGLTDAPAQ